MDCPSQVANQCVYAGEFRITWPPDYPTITEHGAREKNNAVAVLASTRCLTLWASSSTVREWRPCLPKSDFLPSPVSHVYCEVSTATITALLMLRLHLIKQSPVHHTQLRRSLRSHVQLLITNKRLRYEFHFGCYPGTADKLLLLRHNQNFHANWQRTACSLRSLLC